MRSHNLHFQITIILMFILPQLTQTKLFYIWNVDLAKPCLLVFCPHHIICKWSCYFLPRSFWFITVFVNLDWKRFETLCLIISREHILTSHFQTKLKSFFEASYKLAESLAIIRYSPDLYLLVKSSHSSRN